MKCKKFIWLREKEEKGTVTKVDDENMDKIDWLDCLHDVMVKGNITLVDLLDHCSPKR